MTDGEFEGLPVIVSQYVAGGPTGGMVTLINADDVYFSDEAEVNVDMSTEASLQIADDPTVDSVTPTPTTSVSLWQSNAVGFRAERTVNWKRRREGVQVLSEVNWEQAGT